MLDSMYNVIKIPENIIYKLLNINIDTFSFINIKSDTTNYFNIIKIYIKWQSLIRLTLLVV